MTPKVYIVHLRRPKQNDPKETRADPYWEFGSFGCTGCHAHNLMNPRHAHELAGARLAFAQGGKDGLRLVLLTPPITIKQWSDHLEARWEPAPMPFNYARAPILVANHRESDFPSLERFCQPNPRPIEGAFSSRFRSRVHPLPPRLALELVRIYSRLYRAAPPEAFATCYTDALPRLPPKVEHNRRATYRHRLKSLRANNQRSACR